jgi:hypothetical protein
VADVWDELAEAVSTPSANPVISLTPTATPTPTPELGLLERMRQSAYAIPEPFRSLGGMGLSALENPRMIPEEAASIGGSIVGGGIGSALGVPLAPFTGGFSIPAGAVLGGALGSYADVPVQKAIDYFTGVTPTESRLEQATQEAILGAGIESAFRVAGPVAKAASPYAKKIGSVLADYFGPQTAQKAEFLVGEELGRLTTLDELANASEAKKALSSTLPAETLTTAEMTGSDTLAQAERLLKTQPAGNANIEFAANARQKLEDINQSALQLTDLGDPNPKRAGEAAKALLQGAEERQRQAASELFTDEVKSIPVPVKGLGKEAKASFIKFFPQSDINTTNNELWDLYKKLIEEVTPKGKLKKGEAVTTTVGRLQELRSAILDAGRTAKTGTRDEAFADSLSEIIAKQIDSVEGTKGLTAARAAWREYKQRWFFDESGQRAPLNKLLRKQSPEDIIADVSKKSAVSDEYAKVLGGLEPNKLATEMADFANKQTVDEKLKWIRDKRAVYADSPIWPLVQGWEDILTRTAKATKAADVPALSPKNIDIQAKSLVRALGGSERVLAASAGEDATVSAMGNIARSSATSTLGGKISGALSTAALGLGIPTVQRGTDLAAEALTQALQNPNFAAQLVYDAQQLAQRAPAQAALRSQQLTDALNTIAPQAAAFGRGVMGLGSPEPIAQQATTPSATPATTTPMVESDPWAELESAVGTMAETSPTPEPTPEPQTVKVGKQNISIPTGEDFAPASLVKAVMKVESGGKQEAVSPKGARGLMQLMPATARQLGVDPKDPQQNVEGGSKYLQQLLNKYGKKDITLAAYNWGPGNVDKAIRAVKADGKRVTWANIMQTVKVPMETRLYVNKVLTNEREA